MIAIIGTSAHGEVKYVARALSDKGRECVIIDRAANTPFEIAVDQKLKSIFGYYGGVDLNDITLFWYSSKPDHLLFGSTELWAREYVAGVAWQAFEMNLARAAGAPVVNRLDVIDRCKSKLWQLVIACQAGFSIPDTSVTNDMSALAGMIEAGGDRITKMLGDPHVPKIGPEVGQRAVLTNLLPPSLVADRSASLEKTPIFTQSFVDKNYELRVVVVDDQCFAFRIDPKQHQIMNVDYRRGGAAVRYEPITLSDEINSRVLALHRVFGLFSGSYDFMVDGSGELYFLEVNPQGVWSGHDELIDGRISRKFADALILRSQI